MKIKTEKKIEIKVGYEPCCKKMKKAIKRSYIWMPNVLRDKVKISVAFFFQPFEIFYCPFCGEKIEYEI